jgi:hypothetical protein
VWTARLLAGLGLRVTGIDLSPGMLEEVADALRRGGLTDVTITPLEEVLELDRDHCVALGHAWCSSTS